MTTTTGILSDYISRKALAAELGLAEETLIRWEKDGKGPPVTRIGRDVKYSIRAVKTWLQEQERISAQHLAIRAADRTAAA